LPRVWRGVEARWRRILPHLRRQTRHLTRGLQSSSKRALF
jgi:hypothetical protein